MQSVLPMTQAKACRCPCQSSPCQARAAALFADSKTLWDRQGRQLPETDALHLLRRSSRSALWRYLLHLVSLPERAHDAALHTELALVLVAEALQLLRSGALGAADGGHVHVSHLKQLQASGRDAAAHGTGADARDDANSASTDDTGPTSSVAGIGYTDAAELAVVRRHLQEHLAVSSSYDVAALLAQLADTRLWEERVIVHAKARHVGLMRAFAKALSCLTHLMSAPPSMLLLSSRPLCLVSR